MRSSVGWVCLVVTTLCVQPAIAATINVVGIFPNKAVVTVDGAAPRSVSVGDTVGGFKLVSVGPDSATFVVDGKRQTIAMGSYFARPNNHDRTTAVLATDNRGHYVAQGSVNGNATRFLVDTGATMVVLSANEAKRLGVAYEQAPKSMVTTANGTVPYRVVKLDRVKVGDVELTNVDAGIIDGYDGPNLLGMSFLSRTEVTRDGVSMVLTRRF
jgi:aspartyl protease family protein